MQAKNSKFAFLFAALSASALLLSSCSMPVVNNSSTTEPESTAQVQEPEPTDSDSDPAEPGSYINLATYQGNQEAYASSKVVLFFNAEWCSTCEVARNNFEASKSSFPSDLTIVVVDFDDSLELRKQYGVTVQHTFVQIDAEGEALAKWSGSVTVDQIVENTL